MPNADLPTELIPVDLGDGVIAQVEVTETGLEKVKAGTLPFDAWVRRSPKFPKS